MSNRPCTLTNLTGSFLIGTAVLHPYSETVPCSLDDCDLHVWPQKWDDTGMGFKTTGGHAYDTASTTVLLGPKGDASVCHGGRLARYLQTPTGWFWDGLLGQHLPGASESWDGFDETPMGRIGTQQRIIKAFCRSHGELTFAPEAYKVTWGPGAFEEYRLVLLLTDGGNVQITVGDMESGVWWRVSFAAPILDNLET